MLKSLPNGRLIIGFTTSNMIRFHFGKNDWPYTGIPKATYSPAISITANTKTLFNWNLRHTTSGPILYASENFD
jgi:hypothetical protein